MVGAIVRPSRFGAVALIESVLQKKAPAKCARKENRVGRHVILPIFDVPSHKKESGLPPLTQGVPPVSYTHLDVYKRQRQGFAVRGQSLCD